MHRLNRSGPPTAGVNGPELTRPRRSCTRMSESEARTPLSCPPVPTAAGFDDEEPPSKPRRHPLWADVPQHQWDDWRWQSQNAIRSVRQLRKLLPFTDEELE